MIAVPHGFRRRDGPETSFLYDKLEYWKKAITFLAGLGLSRPFSIIPAFSDTVSNSPTPLQLALAIMRVWDK